jgi:Fe-S cluster biogenesis protein NfuA
MTSSDSSPCGGGSPASDPSQKPTGDPARVTEVEKVLEEIRPYLVADGGNIQLISIEDDWVNVRLQGACMGCHASAMTLHQGLEPRLRAACSWVQGVRAV